MKALVGTFDQEKLGAFSVIMKPSFKPSFEASVWRHQYCLVLPLVSVVVIGSVMTIEDGTAD